MTTTADGSTQPKLSNSRDPMHLGDLQARDEIEEADQDQRAPIGVHPLDVQFVLALSATRVRSEELLRAVEQTRMWNGSRPEGRGSILAQSNPLCSSTAPQPVVWDLRSRPLCRYPPTCSRQAIVATLPNRTDPSQMGSPDAQSQRMGSPADRVPLGNSCVSSSPSALTPCRAF